MRTRGAIASTLAIVSLSCASPQPPERSELPQQPPPPIRAFDIPTIEQLAQQMYAQDRIAATASDVLLDQVPEKKAAREGVRHWITGSRDGHNLVRFIRAGDQGPEAGYDVTFAGLAEPTVSVPTDRTLTADEVAQYNARILALENIANPCSDRYNTVALRDPESDGWLVWALAATVDSEQMLIGGHYRFTISPDGKTIRVRDALSTSCLRIESSEESAGSFMSHVVSLTPVETHAFASLSYGRALHVGTLDGTAWRVAEGRITRVEQDAPNLDGFAARALAAVDETCMFITSTSSGSEKSYRATGNTKVIEATEKIEPFTVEGPPGERVEGITCVRRDIVPSPNDYKVLVAGYSLAIGDRGVGHSRRLGKLTLVNGRFAFEIIEGDPLTPELTQRLRARLDAFDRAIQAR